MNWYEDEVRQLQQRVANAPLQSTVFYGSSSIRLWSTLAQDFPGRQTVNIGFGGSTLAACSWFFDDLLVPRNPKSVVFYAGDNDLGDQRNPEEVYLFFCTLVEKMQEHLPGVPLYFISIKPSLARWDLIERIRYTNTLIAHKITKLPHFTYVDIHSLMLDANKRPRKELFEADGLHLSPEGYRLWTEVLNRHEGIF